MKDCAHFRKGFEQWKDDETRRAAFLAALTGAIHNNDLEGFAFSLNMDHYRALDKQIKLTEAFPPYAFTAMYAVAKIREWQRRYRPSDSLLLQFELGDVGQGPFKHKMENEWQDLAIMKPVFMPKVWVENGVTRYSVPFQTADFLAYEINKGLSDFVRRGKKLVRESAFRLHYKDGLLSHQPTSTYLEATHIMDLAQRWRVPRRESTK
jgi:hypothetical protein